MLRPGAIPCRQSLQPARLTQRSYSACAAAGTEQASASHTQSSEHLSLHLTTSAHQHLKLGLTCRLWQA